MHSVTGTEKVVVEVALPHSSELLTTRAARAVLRILLEAQAKKEKVA